MEKVISFSLHGEKQKLQRVMSEFYKGKSENDIFIDLISRGLSESKKLNKKAIASKPLKK